MNYLNNFIHSHEENPIYIAAHKAINGQDINYDLQNAVLKKIFDNVNKKNTQIDLMFPVIKDLSSVTPDYFIKSYQNKIKEVSNNIINVAIFNASDKNIYKTFNMYLDKNELYSIVNNNDRKTAFSYKVFIGKIKDAISDKMAIPFPYSVQANMDKTNKVIQKINLQLFDDIKYLFKYGNLQTSHTIIFDAFENDVRYLFANYESKNDYVKHLAPLMFSVHPNFFDYLKNKKHISMPRNVSVDYVIHNAMNMESEGFKHFSRSFFSNNFDPDLILNFVMQKVDNMQIADEKLKNKIDENLNIMKNIVFYDKIEKEKNKKSSLSM